MAGRRFTRPAGTGAQLLRLLLSQPGVLGSDLPLLCCCPGLPVAELPRSLVQSLAFLLDPSLNGTKNFSHVALELGVAPQLLGRLSGFEQLVAHLTRSGDTVTIPLLAQALQRLQRFDALLLLCDHFVLGQAQGRQC